MKQEPTVVSATVRDATSEAGDELHIECRMSDGQKGAFVVVDAEFPQLAQQIAASLDPKAQAERDARLIELLGADLSADLRVQFEMLAEQRRNGEWTPVLERVTAISPETYYYAPIPYYQGKVLKCQGLVSEENRAWMPEKHPGIIELVGYRGDRIHADTHEVFTQ